MNTYYIISADGNRVGPLSINDLALMLRRGQINAQTLCFTTGMTEWAPLCTTSAASYLFSATGAVTGGQVTAKWGLINSTLSGWRKIFTYSGRASRAEYGYFILSDFCFSILLLLFLMLCASQLPESAKDSEVLNFIFLIFGTASEKSRE